MIKLEEEKSYRGMKVVQMILDVVLQDDEDEMQVANDIAKDLRGKCVLYSVTPGENITDYYESELEDDINRYRQTPDE